jgi:protease I
MSKSLSGAKIAVLVANGFTEKDLTEMQRLIQKMDSKSMANLRIVSMDQGLVNSWNGDAWGLHYAADSALNAALAADYAMLIIPGGRRSVDKLKLTAHTKRFIGGFIDQKKPVAVFEEALELLIFCDKIQGRTVAGPEVLQSQAEAAGATWKKDDFFTDAALITGRSDADTREAYVKAVFDFLASGYAAEVEKMSKAA